MATVFIKLTSPIQLFRQFPVSCTREPYTQVKALHLKPSEELSKVNITHYVSGLWLLKMVTVFVKFTSPLQLFRHIPVSITHEPYTQVKALYLKPLEELSKVNFTH